MQHEAYTVKPPELFFPLEETEEGPLGSVQNEISEFSQKQVYILVAPPRPRSFWFFIF